MTMNIIVVLYNTTLQESVTLKSLAKIGHGMFPKSKLIIVNNGPKPLPCLDSSDLKEKFHSVFVYETIVNIPLAKIYNKFIDVHNDATHHLILDHDTYLSTQFLNELYPLLMNEDVDMIIPQIENSGEKHFPVYISYGILKSKTALEKPKLIASELQSITSGLVISNKTYMEVSNKFGDCFDERYNIYGADTSFFHRAHNLSLKINILDAVLEHDLSHMHNKQLVTNDFRDLDIKYSIAASCIPYLKFKYFALTFINVVKMAFKLDFRNAFWLTFSFLLSRVIKPK
jgi:GT2 family glycosyltransferase